MIDNQLIKSFPLSDPLVMGILNVTPDSFYDGGKYRYCNNAIDHARFMIEEGVDIIDIGGESTRPGAKPVTEKEELDRVIPVIREMKAKLDVKISIDTSKAKVMSEAVAAGADIINDVSALRNEKALNIAADLNVPVCLMHMQGKPSSMQKAPAYIDIINEIKNFFLEKIDKCEKHGIAKTNILLDPGFGFGKNDTQNLILTKYLAEFVELGYPVVFGASRKSTIGNILGKSVHKRLSGSLAFAAYAIIQGAKIIRVHDVTETKEVCKIIKSIQNVPTQEYLFSQDNLCEESILNS